MLTYSNDSYLYVLAFCFEFSLQAPEHAKVLSLSISKSFSVVEMDFFIFFAWMRGRVAFILTNQLMNVETPATDDDMRIERIHLAIVCIVCFLSSFQ